MHCTTCGATLQGDVRFCTTCGAAVGSTPAPRPPAAPSASTWSGLGVPASAIHGHEAAAPSPTAPPPAAPVGTPPMQPPPSYQPAAPPHPPRPPFEAVPTVPIGAQWPPAAGGTPPKRILMIVAAVLVVGVAIGAFMVLRSDDTTTARSGTVLDGVRSDPTDSVVRFDVDGLYRPAVLWGDVLILDTNLPDSDAMLSEVVAVDPDDGTVLWQHDASSYTLFDDTLFVVDDGRLLRLDRTGKQVGATRSVGEEWVDVFGYDGRLYLSEDDLASIDPETLQPIARDIDLSAMSPNGRYALSLEFDSGNQDVEGDDETAVRLVDLDTGEVIGTPFDVDGSGSGVTLDDRRIVFVSDGDLTVFSSDGEALSRFRVGEDARLEVALPGDLVLLRDDQRNTLYSVAGDVEELPGIRPDGYARPTSERDVLIFSDGSSDQIEIVRVGSDGLTSVGRADGRLQGIASGVVYLNDDGRIGAYSLDDPAEPLWAMSLGRRQYFHALDGAVAVLELDWDRESTSIEIYGR